jgi:hypothetical protein
MKTHSEFRIGLSKALLFALIPFLLAVAARPQEKAPYLDSRLPHEQRIADLLSRMTLEEKVAQLTSAMERMALLTARDCFSRSARPFC